MPIRPAAYLLALLLAAPVAAATVATPATFADLLDRAAPGDTIQLAAGSYDAIQLKDRHWSPPVTVDATAARLRGLRLSNVSGLTWHGGTFDGGDVERNGINVNVGDHLIVDGATFSHFVRNGVGLGTVSDARLTNNRFTDMGSDGIDIALSRRIVVDHNHCTDFHPTPGAHPDCVQLWSRPTQPPTADITITDNEAIGDMQGFTAFNGVHPDATGARVGDGGFDRIIVERNVARVSTYHGVTIDDCRHCIVRHNHAESLPNAVSPRVRAWIRVDRGEDTIDCDNHAVGGVTTGSGRCRDDDRGAVPEPSR